MTPRYSIVIPTCDRGDLLEHTLRGILAICRRDVEIVVSDNASTDETPSIIDVVRHDPRIVAVRTDRRLPMPAHWDFAFSKASGEFVIINSDDDGFTPNLLQMLDLVIAKHDAKVLTWHCGLYHYPDHHAEGTPNTFHFQAGHSGLALVMDLSQVIKDYARLDFDFFPEGTRFCLSHALAREIISKTGRLFWSPCPDFSAPLLALLLCKPGQYVYLDKLLGFGGRSQNSNGGAFARGGAPDRVQKFYREFADEDPYPFHEPKIEFMYNGHSAGLSVAKHFFPQELAGIEQDQYVLMKAFYEELRGVRYSPLIDQSDELRLDDYLRNAADSTKAAARAAKEDVDGAQSAPKLKVPWISRLAKFVPFRGVMKQMILQSGFSDLAMPNQQRAIAVSGATHSFSNGYELMRSFDLIVAPDDHLTLTTVERAVKKNALLAAFRI